MATPALRALSNSPEVDELTLVGRPAPLSVLEGLPYAQSTISYKPRSKTPNVLSRRRLASELRRRKLDAIVLLPNSLSTALVAWLANIPQRIGFAKNGRGILLSHSISLDGSPAQAPLQLLDEYTAPNWRAAPPIDYYLHLASQLVVTGNDKRMELHVSEEDRACAEQLLAEFGFSTQRPLIVINNASGSAPSKLWPDEHVVQLARMFAEAGMQVLFHAGPADRETSLKYRVASSHPFIRSMGESDALPLGLTRGLFERAALVVSTDSGPRHIAVALNRPVIGLFGATQIDQTRTYNLPEAVEEVTMSCRPCRKDRCPMGHQNCMRDITPEAVFLRAMRILGVSKTNAA